MEHGAWSIEEGAWGKFRIANFETGNPPEGWESEGQLRNLKSTARNLHSEIRDFLALYLLQ